MRHESGTLAAGDGSLSTGEYYDQFTFQGTGGPVTVDLRARGFDPYLMVEGMGSELVYNDDYEGALDRSLLVVDTRTGVEYTATVTSYEPGEAGSYALAIQNGRAGTRPSQQVAQAQPAQAQPARRRGGLLRGLVGAAIGAGVAAANGGDATQTVGAIVAGAAMMNPDAEGSAAVQAAGQGMITGSGAAGTGAGASGGASYATRPMVSLGTTCPGFTMANYRTRAFEGEGDTQLFTMCGQAFEFYNMYLNAIRQGYSEADANRTYAAHEGAARNAIAFLQNNRSSRPRR